MKLNYLIVFSLFLASIGCTTTNSGTKYRFPEDIKNMCQQEKESAKNCINSKGTPLKEKANVLSVVKVDGQRKFSSGWAWQSPEWNNIWVLGLCYDNGAGNYLIKVGCDPATKQDVRPSVVKHEFGHFWLMSNYREYGHNSKYKDCFFNWVDPAVKSLTYITAEGGIYVIDYVSDDEIE